jgi:hypothetical protein
MRIRFDAGLRVRPKQVKTNVIQRHINYFTEQYDDTFITAIAYLDS